MAGTAREGHGCWGMALALDGDGGGEVVMCWGLIVEGLVFLVQECEYDILGCQKSLDHSEYL